MLPDFPKTKSEIQKRIRLAIDHTIRTKAPILAEFPTFVQHEGTIHTYDRIDAPPKTDGYEEIAIPMTVKLSDVPELTGEKLKAKIEAIAEQLTVKQMELFFKRFTEAAQEVGNAFDADGAPLTQEAFFERLERVQIPFGVDNRPLIKLHTGPELAQVIDEWQRDAAFQTRYGVLLKRKHDEWRDRENNRQLVD